jgi:hypothetical protein
LWSSGFPMTAIARDPGDLCGTGTPAFARPLLSSASPRLRGELSIFRSHAMSAITCDSGDRRALRVTPPRHFLVFVANKDASPNRPLGLPNPDPIPDSAEGRKIPQNTKRNGFPLRLTLIRETIIPGSPDSSKYNAHNQWRLPAIFYNIAGYNSLAAYVREIQARRETGSPFCRPRSAASRLSVPRTGTSAFGTNSRGRFKSKPALCFSGSR